MRRVVSQRVAIIAAIYLPELVDEWFRKQPEVRFDNDGVHDGIIINGTTTQTQRILAWLEGVAVGLTVGVKLRKAAPPTADAREFATKENNQ